MTKVAKASEFSLDFWGDWFFNASLSNLTNEEMDDLFLAHVGGGEL